VAKKVAKKVVKKASTNSRPRGGAKKNKKAATAKASGKSAAARTTPPKKSSARTAGTAGAKSKTPANAKSKTSANAKSKTPANAKSKTSANAKSKTSANAKGKTPANAKGKGLTQVKSKTPKAGAAAKFSAAMTAKKPASRTRPADAASETMAALAEPPPMREPLPEAQLRRAKSGLTRSEIQKYHKRLMTKRYELIGDVEALENDARTDSGDHFSPEHMADIGSNAYDQEFTLGLVESEHKLLREIDEALMRIANRTYGVCAETGEPIGKPRLDAKPWAKYSIQVAREKERLGRM